MLFLGDALAVDPHDWGVTPVATVMRSDAPVGRADWTIGQGLTAMLGADVDHLPVVDDAGGLLGVCTTADILDLADLLDRLDREAGEGDGNPH